MENKLKTIFRLFRGFLFIPLLSFSGLSQAQINVTGTIISGEDDLPLIGAVVQEEGSKKGTLTDIDGNFSISVAGETSTLNISYVGMIKQDIKVGKNRHFRITMKSATELEELVVVGYGVMRKKDITGSLSTIKGDELQKTKTTSFLEAMQGKLSGVQVTSNSGEPGAGVNIIIRGGNSITAGTDPLYVIDGIQVDVNNSEMASSDYTSVNTKSNPLSGINPSDIVSIEILKDASATAIYGSRGANGVVMITTKSGGGDKTEVSLDSYWGISSPNKYIDVLQGQDYADYRFAANPNGGYGELVNGTMQVIDFEARGLNSTNWQKEVLRNALTQGYNLSITSGGKSKTKVSASFGFMKQEGIVEKNSFERYNGRIRADSEINPRLTIGGNVNFSHQIANGAVTSSGGNSYNGLIQSFVLYRPYLINELETDAGDPNNGGLSNPEDFLERSLKTVPTTRTFLDGYFQYKVADGLIWRTTVGGMLMNSKSEEWYPSSTSWGYTPNGLAVLATTNVSSWQNSNTLTYARTFNKYHYINVMGGFELSKYIYSSMNTRAEGFADEGHPGIYDLASAGTFPNKVRTYKDRNQRLSQFGRLNYFLRDKYLFTATLRRDGSSKFGKNSKYGYFPSVALAWKIHNEGFMKKQQVINELKYRVSYGVTGNDRIPSYRSIPLMELAFYPGITVGKDGKEGYAASLGLAPAELANPDLKWESTRQYNTGLDMQLFKGRLTFGVDLYYKQTFDMLLQADVPSQSGSYNQWQNIGQVDNKGIEIALGGTIIQHKDFSWNANVNFNMNRNKVISMGAAGEMEVKVAGGHIVQVGRVLEGHPIGSGWGYVFDGIYQKEDFTDDTYAVLKPGVVQHGDYAVKPGDLKFKNIDGDPENKITNADQTVISNSEPLHFGGFNNTFTYKNIDASIFFQWSYGNDILNIGRYRYEGFIPYFNVTEDYWQNRWTETNSSSIYPRIQGQGTTVNSSYYVEDGSYLRLKNIVVGYTFPSHITKKLYLSSLRVYASADNVLTFTNYSGYDPEVSYWNTLISGLDYTSYPRARTFTIGANIKF